MSFLLPSSNPGPCSRPGCLPRFNGDFMSPEHPCPCRVPFAHLLRILLCSVQINFGQPVLCLSPKLVCSGGQDSYCKPLSSGCSPVIYSLHPLGWGSLHGGGWRKLPCGVWGEFSQLGPLSAWGAAPGGAEAPVELQPGPGVRAERCRCGAGYARGAGGKSAAPSRAGGWYRDRAPRRQPGLQRSGPPSRPSPPLLRGLRRPRAKSVPARAIRAGPGRGRGGPGGGRRRGLSALICIRYIA